MVLGTAGLTRGASTRWAVVLLGLGAAAAVHAALGSPGLVHLPGWFYRPTRPGVRFGGLTAGALAAALALAVLAYRVRKRSRFATLLALFGASLLAQLAFMALSPEGLATYWARLGGGHGEFLQVAHARADALATLRDYDALVASDALGHFPPSKPPGALAAYFLVDRLGEVLQGPLDGLVASAAASPARGHAAGAAVALWLFPLWTALVSPLACALGWVLDRRRLPGVVAGLLHAFAPTTLLVTHHLDGALYPIFAVGVAACWTGAAARAEGVGRAFLSATGGALLALGLYTSFSLLPAGLLGGLLALGVWWRRRAERRSDGSDALGILAAAAAGFALVFAVLVLVLDFQPLARFENAIAHHEQWKAAVPTLLWRFVAPLELFLWVGWPLVVVFVAAVARGALRGEHRRKGWVALMVLGVLLLSSALAGTNEVARLWAFLVPFIAVAVGLAFRWRPAPLAALLAAQLSVGVALAAAGPW